MHLDVRGIKHLERGAIGTSQDSKPLSLRVGLSIGQNQNITVSEEFFAIIQIAGSFGVPAICDPVFSILLNAGGCAALHLRIRERRQRQASPLGPLGEFVSIGKKLLERRHEHSMRKD